MGAVENIKEVADLVKKFNDIELNRRILTLENEVLDLSRDKRRLEEKTEELERVLNLQREIVFDEPYFWLKGDPTPFCPACWERKRKAVHLAALFDNGKHARHDCPVCKHEYVINAATWHNVSGDHRR
jgi:DNA repair exonuclease SbcCD ATPase subunit